MADLETLEAFDGMAGMRKALHAIAERDEDWSGIPMLLEDTRLVIEPTHPKANLLTAVAGAVLRAEAERAPVPDGLKLRNRWWSHEKRCDIYVIQDGERITWGLVPGIHNLGYAMQTMGCSDAWGIEQESHALELLATLVRHRQFKQYLLTGMFLESSRRSGVSYLFRKLRPTVALHTVKDQIRILAALCLHPIAYYDESWAGAMCPTDDVIAHLMLMRGDEHLFWRRANQHPAWRPEAGL